jgi:hypothetical protein
VQPVVSVLVPAHRGHASLLRASVPPVFDAATPLEVVLVHTGEPGAAPSVDARVRLVEAGPEAGFCRAINAGIEASRAQLVLFSNADLFLTDGYVDELVRVLEARGAACAGGKLLRLDLATGRATRTLDTTGLVVGRSRRAWDRGEGSPDVGQYGDDEEVFGVSGAGLLVRRSALERVRIGAEYLDESFVAYKDDVDLAWRLRLAGLSCRYVPTAVAYHARTSRGLGGRAYLRAPLAYHRNEARKPPSVRRRSLVNHWLLLVKNEGAGSFVRDAPWIVGREVLSLGYTLATTPGAAGAVPAFLSALPGALAKRRAISRTTVVRPDELRRRWFGTPRRPRSNRA